MVAFFIQLCYWLRKYRKKWFFSFFKHLPFWVGFTFPIAFDRVCTESYCSSCFHHEYSAEGLVSPGVQKSNIDKYRMWRGHAPPTCIKHRKYPEKYIGDEACHWFPTRTKLLVCIDSIEITIWPHIIGGCHHKLKEKWSLMQVAWSLQLKLTMTGHNAKAKEHVCFCICEAKYQISTPNRSFGPQSHSMLNSGPSVYISRLSWNRT